MTIKLFESWAETRARKAAARWMVRMHGPDAFRWRGAFEAWRVAHPRNARAYARQQAIWGAMPRLGLSAEPTAAPAHGLRLTPLRLAAGLVSASIAVGALLLWPRMQQPAPLVIAAEPARARAERLADGSRVLLDRGSQLEVRFAPDERRLRLTQGRARLDLVAARGRPAIVRAGRAEVRTDRARLDMALEGEGARIILLAGRVELAAYAGAERRPADVELESGQIVHVGTAERQTPARAASPAELAWPAGMISFIDAPVGDVIARANAASFSPITVADPAIAALRVTGAYRAGDAAGLAESLATMLNLKVLKSREGALTLAWRRR